MLQSALLLVISVLSGTKLSTLSDEILIDEAPVPARVEPHAVRVAAFSEAVVKQMDAWGCDATECSPHVPRAGEASDAR